MRKKELEVPFYSSCSYPDGMPYVERKQQIWGIEGLKARKTKCIRKKKKFGSKLTRNREVVAFKNTCSAW